jgi:hypothetical protein
VRPDTAADSAIEIWTATASAPLTDEQITVTFANAPERREHGDMGRQWC